MIRFAAGNLAALAVTLVAGRQPWLAGAGASDVALSLVRGWLPFTLALCALGTALVALSVPRSRRDAFLARHFLLYLAVPFTLLFIASNPRLLNGQAASAYVLLPFAFAAHALAGIWTALAASLAPSDRRVALMLGAISLAASLAIVPYHRTVQPTASDEPHYLIVMQSLVDDRDLDVRNDYEGDRYLRFYPAVLEDIHGVRVGNAIYSIRDLGLPLLGAVPFALGGRNGVLALVSLAGALLAAQLYLLLRDLGLSPRIALLGSGATVFTHPFFTYTSQIYPELLAALAFVGAVRLLRHGTASGIRELALASALLGTLPWLTTRAWFVVIGVGLVVAWRALRPFSLARALAGALPFAGLVLLLSFVNWRTFGLFMPAAGYYLIKDQQEVLAFAPQVGALGLFFDRAFGLIGRAPLYLLAFLGLPALVRRARAGHAPELVPLALGWLLSFVYIADIAYWWADGSPPSRYLVATVPFLTVALACGIETIVGLTRPSAQALATALAWTLAGWSVYATFLFAVQPGIGYDLALDVRATGSSGRFWELAGRAVRPDLSHLYPSLVRIDGATVALSLLWVAVAVALVIAGWKLRAPDTVGA